MSVFTTVVASTVARWLVALVVGALLIAGVVWYFGRDDRQRERDKAGEQAFQDTMKVLDAARRERDSLKIVADARYQPVAGTITRIIERGASLPPGQAVPRPIYDSLAKACSEILPLCDQKVAARDRIIADRDREIEAWKKRPAAYRDPPRFTATLVGLVDWDSTSIVGRGALNLRVWKDIAAHVELQAESGARVRKFAGVSYTFH